MTQIGLVVFFFFLCFNKCDPVVTQAGMRVVLLSLLIRSRCDPDWIGGVFSSSLFQ